MNLIRKRKEYVLQRLPLIELHFILAEKLLIFGKETFPGNEPSNFKKYMNMSDIQIQRPDIILESTCDVVPYPRKPAFYEELLLKFPGNKINLS